MRRAALLTLTIFMLTLALCSVAALGQAPVLNAEFTATPITVDGMPEAAWDKATPSHIAIAMKSDLSAVASDCPTSGDVRAMWDGPLLYLLISVTDPDVTTASDSAINKDGVEVYFDQFNDKMSKFEEDDGMVRISAPATSLTGNKPQNTIYDAVWSSHLKAYASAYRLDAQGNRVGYNVELAWNIGDRPKVNGTAIGIEFGINDAASSSNTRNCRTYWSSGNNHGLDSNTAWGTVMLSGYDGRTPMALDTFMLMQNIAKANALPRGIWKSETQLNQALAAATSAQSAGTQEQMDASNTALDTAIKNLRRSGKYPDPYDLPPMNYLPDPFTFFNGKKVKSVKDWAKRREEIKDLAQYYEFGYLPPIPESVAASTTPATGFTAISVTIQDHGQSASFNAGLTLPTAAQSAASGKSAPYPVIVSLDVNARAGNSTYLDAGYAVLSIPTYAIASDNIAHTGAFFTLYPYNAATGHDAGVLMAWGWGASRGVDALQYLVAHDPNYAKLLDLHKLAVTGFSRWGKSALVIGLLDERFGVVNPGGSGSGGAAPYRYDSYGNHPARSTTLGNKYPWGTTPGAEIMGDHIRHQTHNSNEMIRRFLNPDRMYKTTTHGYGERLPYDHHEIIASIAPRAVLIYTTNDDYGNNAEGDSIGYEGAKPVYEFLGASQNLAFDIYMGGGGHSPKPSHRTNLVSFCDMVFYGKPLGAQQKVDLYKNPYANAAIYDAYYGGLKSMMPWVSTMPRK